MTLSIYWFCQQEAFEVKEKRREIENPSENEILFTILKSNPSFLAFRGLTRGNGRPKSEEITFDFGVGSPSK